MKKVLYCVLASLLFVVMFSIISFGQETAGTIEITTKDSQGNVVPGVTVTLVGMGPKAGYTKTITTDDKGFARVLDISPGPYSLTASAIAGFAEQTISMIFVKAGQSRPVSFELYPESSGGGCGVKITTTEVPTIVKGLNYSSVLEYSPATRPERRSGQFQIDGASGSENTFIIDGLEVNSVLTGKLELNNDLPFSQLQEIQIKAAVIDAEWRSATGGIINVITKSGGNEFHGEFGAGFRSSKLEPVLGPTLRSNNNVPEYYPNRRDQYNETNPTANVGGPIIRDKVWFFATYAPQIFSQSRTLVFLDPFTRVPTGRVETYNFKQRKEVTFGRIDAQPFIKLHLNGTINWNPITQNGLIPGYTAELNPNTASGSANSKLGGRQNSMNFRVQATYTATNNLIINASGGHYFLNQKLGTYGIPSIGEPRVVCTNIPFSPSPYPPGFGCVRANPPDNGVVSVSNTEYDASRRNQFDGDATYMFVWGGRHEIKGGYQYSQVGNKILYGTTDLITLRSGSTGLARVGTYAGRDIPSTPGAIGSGKLSTFRTTGDVSGTNHAIYIQDRWQPTSKLTLNLGLRAENENIPSYARGLSGFSFGWGSKLAPRLGASYDLTGDGKTKLSGFFGLFYDRMKLTLARSQFGADEFHDIYFEWFPGDTIYTLNRETILGPGNSPIPGGVCPLNTLPPVYGRVRCDIDYRVSANSGGPLTEVGGVDPDIKPFTQREFTAIFQREIARRYIFSARYTHKDVLHAVEDAGFPNPEGSEYYIVGNPGEGLHKRQADAFGLIAPKPERVYDALELRFDRQFANHFFFNANYTYSRLYGNYSGLASSDEEGRADPNVTRYFDQPQAAFTAAGGPDNGRLATDRPHVFNAYGAYSLGWDQFGLWENNTTDFSFFTTAQSGTLITTFFDLNNYSQLVLTKRGDQGRTPMFTQTDFAIHHGIRFGKDARYTLKLDLDILNLFNEYNITNLGLNPSGQGGNIINLTNFNPLDPNFHLVSDAQSTACAANPSAQQQCLLIAAYQTFQLQGSPEMVAAAQGAIGHNPFYNLPTAWQTKRQIRYGIRLLF